MHLVDILILQVIYVHIAQLHYKTQNDYRCCIGSLCCKSFDKYTSGG